MRWIHKTPALSLACTLMVPGVVWSQPSGETSSSQPTTAPSSQPSSQPTSLPSAPTTSPADKAEEDPYKGLDHTGTPPLPPKENRLPPDSAKPGQRRPAPSYDGRPSEISAGEALIWIPRVLLYPAHLVLEWGVRWPITGLMTTAEKHFVFQRIERFFTFADGQGGLFPTLFFDFGVNPSFGFYFFYDDLFVEKNRFVLQAAYWPSDWIHLAATDTLKVFRDDSGTLTTRAEFLSRPDYVYHGLGPSTRQEDERFFRMQAFDLGVDLRAALKDLNRITLGLHYRSAYVTDGNAPSINLSELPPLMATAPGFGESYNLVSTRLGVELDTRSPDRIRTPGTGLRLELFGSHNFDPARTALNYFRWGGEASGYLDLSGLNHVLQLAVYTEMVEKVGDADLPITEELSLGGPEHLRGFLEGRLRGHSAFVVTLDYRYPVWTFLDADLFVTMGNTFNGRLEKLHGKRFVMCWGFGLRTNTSRNVSFDLLLAFGTNQVYLWDENFEVDNIRFIAGINQGF